MTAASAKQVRLSIVIAAWNNTSLLRQCLASLARQADREDTEVIVASNYDSAAREMAEREFPKVKLISLPEETTVPELRTRGISCASGEVVALLEDHCTFDENWRAEIIKAHELPYSIIGGSVENASVERPLDWAVYFYDYAKYMLPNQPGVVDSLSGINVSYKRSVLDRVEQSFRQGFMETFINEELKQQGELLYLAPAAVVYHQKHYEMKDAFVQTYRYGRSFSGMRTLNVTLLQRLGLILGSLMLPALLSSRIVLRTVKKGRYVKELFWCLPHLLLLVTSWSYGELCGYIGGEVDNPSRRV
ncbi:MAG: glycosyltransferase [Acidobacteria bacterium]|nr:glycosyltransferase [Acidobacteriota bacterium]